MDGSGFITAPGPESDPVPVVADFESIKRAVQLNKAREDFYFFSRHMFKVRRGFQWVPALHHMLITQALAKVLSGETKRLIINVPPRYSKAIDCDTPMWTPNGWVRAGEIRNGDQLLGSDGKWTTVIGVHPQGVKGAYEVKFSDGASLVACGDHRWSVRLRDNDRRRDWVAPWHVKTTDELRDDLLKADGRRKWRIPVLVDGNDKDVDLPIDPYLLGCWLGDGSSYYAAITTMDPEIVEAFAAYDPKPHTHQSGGKATTYGLRNGLGRALKDLGLLGDKHIPKVYMLASHRQRLALLQGLGDTDGWVAAANGQQGVCFSNKRLSDDVRSLVNSLGGVWRGFSSQPTVGNLSYKTFLSMPIGDVAFRLPRKVERINPRRERNSPRRFVASITPVDPRQMVCFTVNAEDHLFCAGRDFVVTHNTELSVINFMAYALGKFPDSEFIHTSYSGRLAANNSWQTRELVQHPEYREIFPDVRLRADSAARNEWRTTAGGVVYAVGAGGTITGYGAGKMRREFGGCFPYEQPVETENGPMAIGDIVTAGTPVRVWSFNEITRVRELCQVTRFWRNPANHIVEVAAEDGRAFRCTPDHEILTDAGWISAIDLTQPLDLQDRQPGKIGSLLSGEAAINSDLHDAFRMLWLCVPQGIRQMLRDGCPGLAQLDLANDANADTVLSSDLLRAFHTLENGRSLLASELGAGAPLQDGECAVAQRVLHVVGLSAIREIGQRVVAGVSVEVPDLMAFGSWAYELLRNDVRDVSKGDLPADREADASVALPVVRRLQRSKRASSADVPKVGHLVQASGARDLTPDAVRYVGHVEETFCLEVEGNHNFILAQSGAIVSNCIVIDDPHKADEARSDLIREGVIEWFQNTLESRKNGPDTPIILTMQRLHDRDLAGWLLDGGNGEHWESLVLPAIQDDGTALWPFKHDITELRRMEEAAPMTFAGQYMQAPSPAEGNIFKPDKIQVVDAMPADPTIRWVRGWDLAATREAPGKNPDWTVGFLLGFYPDGRLIIADVVRMRGSPDEVEAAIINTAHSDGRHVKISLPQDPGQAGKFQVQYLVRKLQGYTVHTSPESGDKVTRAEPFASQINIDNASMVAAPWNNNLKAEMRVFPNGSHDDIVDAGSRAFSVVGARSQGNRISRTAIQQLSRPRPMIAGMR